MALEDKIDTLIEAIRSLDKRIAGMGGTAAPAATEAASAATTEAPAKRGPGRPPKASAPKVTADDVKAAAKALMDAKDKETAKALIKKFGSDTLAGLPEAKWADFVAAAKAAAEATDDEGGDDEGGDEL